MYGSGRLLLSIKKEVSGTFSFTCSITALPVSYTALSTWSRRFTSRDLYLPCRSLASRARRSFYFGPPKINGSNSTSISALIAWPWNNGKKNYENINTTFSFSVLCFFRSVGYLLHITAHERMHLLPVNTKEGGTQNKLHVPSRVLLLCTYS